ncbi:MAG: hypothetical protein ACE5JE_04735 [Thermoplasmata archaeon]
MGVTRLAVLGPAWAVLILLLLLSGAAHARCFGVPEDTEEVWAVPLYATSEFGFEDEAVFGVVRGATKLLERGLDEVEGAAGSDTQVRAFLFLEQLLRFPPAKLNKSFIAPADDMIWVLGVEYREERPSVVTLRWLADEVRGASPQVGLRLVDGNTSVDMLATASYAFDATVGTRSFRIEATALDETGDTLLFIILVLAAYGGLTAIFLLLRRRGRRS